MGGWLILVGINIIVSPIRLLIVIFSTFVPIFSDGTWEQITNQALDGYHPLWAPLIVGEIAFNAIIFVASLYLIYLYFSKHYLFPKTFIAIIFLSTAFVFLDAWIVTLILPGTPFDPDAIKELSQSILGAAIWVPYMLISKRVKATFVEHMPDKTGQATADLFS